MSFPISGQVPVLYLTCALLILKKADSRRANQGNVQEMASSRGKTWNENKGGFYCVIGWPQPKLCKNRNIMWSTGVTQLVMGRGLLTCVIKSCEAAMSRQHVPLPRSLTSEGEGGGRWRGRTGPEKISVGFSSNAENDDRVERDTASPNVSLHSHCLGFDTYLSECECEKCVCGYTFTWTLWCLTVCISSIFRLLCSSLSFFSTHTHTQTHFFIFEKTFKDILHSLASYPNHNHLK